MEGLEAFYTTVAGNISCPQDAVVGFVHWAITKSGYKCVGLGDVPAAGNRASELLPAGWNANKEVYTLRYQGKGGAGRYLLKAQAVDDLVIVNMINSETLRESDLLTVSVGDHVAADAGRLQSFDGAYRDAGGLAEEVKARLLRPQEEPATAEKETMTEDRRHGKINLICSF